MPTFELSDGTQMHYHDIGRGPVCVLLHGFAMKGAWWRPLLLGLTKRHRFILPDFRGFGGSHDMSYPHADVISQSANDLHQLMDYLQLDHVALAGLSMGACVAMRYFELFGHDHIHRYLNIDQAPCVNNKADWRWGLFGDQQAERYAEFEDLLDRVNGVGRPKQYKRLPRRVRWDLEQGFSRFIGDAFHLPHRRHSSALSIRLPVLTHYALPRRNWHAYMDCMAAYKDQAYDFRDGLSKVKIPITAMVGMRSRLYPAEGQLAIARMAPDVRIHRFEESGHALPFERPLRFRKGLVKFLNRD